MSKESKLPRRCYVLTHEHIRLVRKWAQEDDRSNSSIIRRLIDKESKRRKVQTKKVVQN